jgi:hypothetical protein
LLLEPTSTIASAPDPPLECLHVTEKNTADVSTSTYAAPAAPAGWDENADPDRVNPEATLRSFVTSNPNDPTTPGGHDTWMNDRLPHELYTHEVLLFADRSPPRATAVDPQPTVVDGYATPPMMPAVDAAIPPDEVTPPDEAAKKENP